MSNISEWTNRCCFVWAVERPVIGRSRYSPEFSVNCDSVKNELRLEFLQCKQTYYLLLKPLKRKYMYFNVTVHVEDKNRCILPLCSYKKCYEVFDAYVWQYAGSDILKEIPDFLTNGLVLFVITIDNEPQTYEFTLQPPREKKDKPVQTPSFMSVAPCLESLSDDFSKLLEKDSRPDVTLACGELNLRVHRNILSCRSEVFSAMLSNDMTEGLTGQIQIRDMDSRVFETFVRYLYTGNLPDLTEKTARCLYEAADKYAVVGLQKRCASFFLEILSRENACEMLVLADAHSDVDFKESVLVYILEKEIHMSEDIWLPFGVSHPVLAIEVLNRFCKLVKGK